MITLRLDHVLYVVVSTLFLAGCSGQIGAPVAPTNLTAPGLSLARPESRPEPTFTLQNEILSGTYSSMCAHSKLEFVGEGKAIGPIKGTFLAYGSWKVGPNVWQFQERFTIKSRMKNFIGSVLGTEPGGRSTCEDFKGKPLFYFAHHEEGRVRAVIGHDHFSRVFLEQFEHGLRGGPL